MFKFFYFQKGQSVLEALLAVAIFGMVGVVLTGMILGSFGALQQGGEQTEAEALAEEGIEAVRSVHDRVWNEMINGQIEVAESGGQWVLVDDTGGDGEAIGQFIRTITIEDVCRDVNDDIVTCGGLFIDVSSKKVTSRVDWTIRDGITNYVVRYAYLTNWDSLYWTQTDWSGGSGQTIWSNITRYYSDDGNIDNSTAGSVSLVSSGAACAGNTWTFDTPGNYNYDTNKIEVTGGMAQLKAGVPSGWWNSNYAYRKQITVTNNDPSILVTGYSVNTSIDHYALTLAAKALASGDDVRIVYWNGSTNVELDRINETVWNTNGTNAELWFKTQADISTSGLDNNYYIYYGYSGAVSPPVNKDNVYVFFDGFESGDYSNWTDQTSSSLDILGTYDTTADANDIFKVGNTAYVVTRSATGAEFYIFDVSTPSAPSLLGSLNLGVNAFAVYVSGNYAYLATTSNSQELMVIDISNPASLSIDGSYNADSGANGSDIFVVGNYAYLGTKRNNSGGANPEFYILDISTPTSPSLAGSLDLPGDPHANGLHISGDYAYIATNSNSQELMVIDISNPASLSIDGSYNADSGANAMEVFVQGNYAYLVTRINNSGGANPEFYILDITTPTTPSLVGSLDIGDVLNDVYVPAGSNYAYVGTENNSASLQLIDISTPASPSVFLTFNFGDNTNGVFVDNNFVYVATEDISGEFKILGPPAGWSVGTDQVYAGNYSLKAPQVSNANRWLTANGINESNLLLESYWRFNGLSTIDISQGFRTSSSIPINQYETNLEATNGWNIAKMINDTWTEIAINAGTPQNDTWTKITTIIDGSNMKILQDGTQIVPGSGWTNVGAELTIGSVGFRAWDIGSSSNWWIDDVKVRKYVDPEPTTALGGELTSSSYPTDLPPINPISSYAPSVVDSWTTFTEVAIKGTQDTIIDDTQAEFDSGSYSDLQYDSVNSWVELTATGQTNGTGVYTSQIHNAGSSIMWNNISWVPSQPYGKELPDNESNESDYSDGNAIMQDNEFILHFGENAGSTTFSDTSGNSNDATCTNCPTAGAGGQLNTAVNFDNDSLVTPSSPTLQLTNDVTVSMWVNVDILPGSGYSSLITYTTPGESMTSNTMYELFINSGGDIRYKHEYGSGLDEIYLFNTNLVPGTWYHIAFTRDDIANTVDFYVNGVYLDTFNYVNDPAGGDTAELWLGYDGGNPTRYYDGSMDELAIWSRKLTIEEIIYLYERGSLRILFQVRSCNDPACSGEVFVGPDGTASTYYTESLSSGSGLPSFGFTNIPDNQYFQYQVTFETDDTTKTPELISVTLNAGGEIYYQISDNDGATWYYWDGVNWSVAGAGNYNIWSTVNNNLWEFSSVNKKFMFKAFLESNGTQQVQLDEVSVGCDLVNLEAGTVNTDENWTTVNLQNMYNNPIVVASYYEGTNILPASTRIRNLDQDSFEIKLQNPAGGNLDSSEITYFVIEQGKWEIGGVKFEANKYNTNTVGSLAGGWNYDTKTFETNFANDPIVLHQVMTNNDASWISTYVSRSNSQTDPPDTGGMRIALNGAEATATHSTETIGWIAIDKDQTSVINTVDFETYRTLDSVQGHDDSCYDYPYQNSYGAPLVLGFQQEMDDTDGGWSVTCANSSAYASLHIEEDQENDLERSHTTETNAFIAFGQSFSYASGAGGPQVVDHNFSSSPSYIVSDSSLIEVDANNNNLVRLVNTGIATISSRVSSGNDDAEEQNPPNGSMYLTSTDLELITDTTIDQEVGMRFQNISIPQGATITSAYIEFTVDETDSGTTNLTFYGDDTDNAGIFTSTSGNITGRTKTTANVAWNNVPAWTSIGSTQQTPDISSVIQELVNRAGWSSGNSMAIIVDGTGERTAESYNGSPSQAPLLVVSYISTSYSISSRVSSGNDDAEEQNPPNGSMYLTSTDLELITDTTTDQEVGMRFQNISIPQGATITSAYIEFTVDETDSGTTNLTFYGDDTDNAGIFTSTSGNITGRTKTTANVLWNNVPSWTSVGTTQQTPDLSSVIQELVNRAGWASGNSMAIIVDGTGERTAESYNGSSSQAPLLVVDYTVSSPYSIKKPYVELATPYTLSNPTSLNSITDIFGSGNAGTVEYSVKLSGTDKWWNGSSWITNSGELQPGDATWNANLISAWHLNDSSGAIVDAKGSNNGTYNGVLYSQSGKLNTALGLDGTNDYVDLGNPANLQLTGAITIGVWVNINTMGNDYLVTKMGGAGSISYDLSINSDGTGEFRVGGASCSTTISSSTYAIPANEWIYLVGTYEPSSYIRFFVNGVLAAENTSAIPASQCENGLNWYLGAREGNQGFVDGTMDEVAIYNQALTPAEIRQLYADQNNNKHSNIEADLDANLTSLSVFNNDTITLLSYLISDGTQKVELDDVDLLWTQGSIGGGTGYATSGYVISSAFDMGDASPVQVIEWDETIPVCTPTCQIKLQIQTAPDNAGVPGTWSATWSGPDGEDGDETDYYTYAKGEMIHTDHNNDQWVRYKATLIGDGADTPILGEVRVNYR